MKISKKELNKIILEEIGAIDYPKLDEKLRNAGTLIMEVVEELDKNAGSRNRASQILRQIDQLMVDATDEIYSL